MHRFTLLARILVLLACALPVHGEGALRVAPTRVELSRDKLTSTITVSNTSAQRTLLQVEAKSWSQYSGRDEYLATDEIIVSPPIFSLDPGAEQIVRIGRRRGLNADEAGRELAYRLFVKEVPTAASDRPQGLNVVLQIGVPMFATPPSATEAELSWTLRCVDNGARLLTMQNRGQRALRLDELAIRAGTHEQLERAVYVLGGATRAIQLNETFTEAHTVEIVAGAASRELRATAACD
jgi:fimbrial chaperone protein